MKNQYFIYYFDRFNNVWCPLKDRFDGSYQTGKTYKEAKRIMWAFIEKNKWVANHWKIEKVLVSPYNNE